MPSPVTVSKSGPGALQVIRDLNRIKQSEVLVGIPAEKTQRAGEPINNAALMFVHTHGSPLRNIPPRPVLEPAIEKNSELITPHLAESAKAVMDGRPDAAERELQRAGTIASNAVKRYFTEGNLAPNAPSTIARKGSDRPLIDTGALRRAVTFVVRSGGRSSAAPKAKSNSSASMGGSFSSSPAGAAENAAEAAAESVAEVL
jgi:hypothetical protein